MTAAGWPGWGAKEEDGGWIIVTNLCTHRFNNGESG